MHAGNSKIYKETGASATKAPTGLTYPKFLTSNLRPRGRDPRRHRRRPAVRLHDHARAAQLELYGRLYVIYGDYYRDL